MNYAEWRDVVLATPQNPVVYADIEKIWAAECRAKPYRSLLREATESFEAVRQRMHAERRNAKGRLDRFVVTQEEAGIIRHYLRCEKMERLAYDDKLTTDAIKEVETMDIDGIKFCGVPVVVEDNP